MFSWKTSDIKKYITITLKNKIRKCTGIFLMIKLNTGILKYLLQLIQIIIILTIIITVEINQKMIWIAHSQIVFIFTFYF